MGDSMKMFIIIKLLSLIIIIFLIIYKRYFKNCYYVIINRGKVDFKELFDSQYSINSLYVELKKRNISSINYIDYCMVDRRGNIHLFVGDKFYPIPLIIDGVIDEDSLMQINKSKNWLEKIIDDENLCINNIIYSFYKNNEIIFIKR